MCKADIRVNDFNKFNFYFLLQNNNLKINRFVLDKIKKIFTDSNFESTDIKNLNITKITIKNELINFIKTNKSNYFFFKDFKLTSSENFVKIEHINDIDESNYKSINLIKELFKDKLNPAKTKDRDDLITELT
jgi:hypothetical protein